MSSLGIRQTDIRWLKRVGEMTDPCGTAARTWKEVDSYRLEELEHLLFTNWIHRMKENSMY